MTAITDPVPGTEGYAARFEGFLAASEALDFETVNADFLPYLPKAPARVLDLGAGVGQNAAALAELGHAVTAVEPLAVFLEAARDRHGTAHIRWLEDSLPELRLVSGEFDFVLVDGVWQHLSEGERRTALPRIRELLAPGGRLALSLRHGPAGAGTRIYPIDDRKLMQAAADVGLEQHLYLSKQPSLMPNKTDVSWSRVLFQLGDPEREVTRERTE